MAEGEATACVAWQPQPADTQGKGRKAWAGDCTCHKADYAHHSRLLPIFQPRLIICMSCLQVEGEGEGAAEVEAEACAVALAAEVGTAVVSEAAEEVAVALAVAAAPVVSEEPPEGAAGGVVAIKAIHLLISSHPSLLPHDALAGALAGHLQDVFGTVSYMPGACQLACNFESFERRLVLPWQSFWPQRTDASGQPVSCAAVQYHSPSILLAVGSKPLVEAVEILTAFSAILPVGLDPQQLSKDQ